MSPDNAAEEAARAAELADEILEHCEGEEHTTAILAVVDAATKLIQIRDNCEATAAGHQLRSMVAELLEIEEQDNTPIERRQHAVESAFVILRDALQDEGEHAIAIIFCDNGASAFMRGTPGGPDAAKELRDIADAAERALAETAGQVTQ